jgi:hypothetical protein
MKETLEEAAEKGYRFEADPMMPDKREHQDFLRIFKKGAQWQAERMYSEEEVLELLQKALTHQDDGEIGSLVTIQGQIRTANFYSWFEQFKKK